MPKTVKTVSAILILVAAAVLWYGLWKAAETHANGGVESLSHGQKADPRS